MAPVDHYERYKKLRSGNNKHHDKDSLPLSLPLSLSLSLSLKFDKNNIADADYLQILTAKMPADVHHPQIQNLSMRIIRGLNFQDPHTYDSRLFFAKL